jgi:hypothetical protein
VIFYATADAFASLADMIRRTGKTYDAFKVAQTFLADPERFQLFLRSKQPGAVQFYSTIFDGVPFLSRESALNHLMAAHLDRIFEKVEEECEAPAGNFQQVARCPFTKAILGAPNHHSYKGLLDEHYLRNVRNMPFESYCEKLEFSRDAADIGAWLEKMKKRYSYILRNQNGEAGTESGGVEDACGEAQAQCACGGEDAEAGAVDGAAAKAEAPRKFNSIGDVRIYLVENADEFLSVADSVSLPGMRIGEIMDREIRDAVDCNLDRQRQFPLETANGMRGNIKKHNLFSYKIGKRGPSYVASVSRKTRSGNTAFTAELGKVLDIVGQNPRISPLELCIKFGPAADVEKMMSALRWLIVEGYVAEFDDGTLQVHGSGDCAAEQSDGADVGAASRNSKGAKLNHVCQGEEHCSCDERDHAGHDEDCEGLKDCGSAVDAVAKLLFEDVGGIVGHGGECSAAFSDGNEAPDRCGDGGCGGEEFSEVDALSGAQCDRFKVAAQCCVGNCPAGEAEGVGERDPVAED